MKACQFRAYLGPLLLLSLLSPSLQPVHAQRSNPDFYEVEKTALAELARTKTPGAVMTVVSGDRVIFTKAFGVSNVETRTPVTTDMIFRTGSAGKMLTAVVLLMLAEEGKIKLDEPIGRYVSGLTPKLSRVTAHQLLTHTSGLNDEYRNVGSHDEAALAQTIRSWKDDYYFLEPGEMFNYSNPGYAVTGLVIEELDRKPFATVMSERLFKPLGMNHTTFFPWLAMTYPLSQGHVDNRGEIQVLRPFDDPAALRPAGLEFSNVNDLARFAIALLNGGKIEAKQVLSPAVIAQLTTPHVPMHSHPNPIPMEKGMYGYGVFIHEDRGVRIVEHTGVLPGFGCRLLMVPEHRLAIIIMTNRTGETLNQTINKTMELLLLLKPRSTTQTLTALSEVELLKYVGIYDNPRQSRVEVVLKNGGLIFRVSGNELPMTRIGEHRFSIPRPTANEIAFVIGPDGKATFRHTGLRAWKRIEPDR